MLKLFLKTLWVAGFLWASPLTTHALTVFKCTNGLTVLVEPDHRSPIVLSSIWYAVGSGAEHSGITGLSHLLEHMMFRGTSKYPSGAQDRLISAAGGIENAMTSRDFTAYYQRLPKDQLALSFQLEADRMRQMAAPIQWFTKEKAVVMEERRLRVDTHPNARVYEQFNAAAYTNSPYHHPTVGWMTDLEHLTRADLMRWYNCWYYPNNAYLVVVGDVEPKAVFHLAQQYFGAIPSHPLPQQKPRTQDHTPVSKHLVMQLPSASMPMMVIGYPAPSLVSTRNAKQAFALLVLAQILGGSNSALLPASWVRAHQYALSVSADYDFWSRYPGLFVLTVVPKKNGVMQQIESSWRQIMTRLQRSPVTQEQLERAKAKIHAEQVYAQDSLLSQVIFLARPVLNGVRPITMAQFLAAVDRVTAKEVMLAAQQVFNPQARVLAELFIQRKKT